ncbi:hypothetical protein EV126DRAFT_209328 [Verticillium dahliae]|nr:hypothetical protein EV126DRAFT_209328 [Verticillium dahliae]
MTWAFLASQPFLSLSLLSLSSLYWWTPLLSSVCLIFPPACCSICPPAAPQSAHQPLFMSPRRDATPFSIPQLSLRSGNAPPLPICRHDLSPKLSGPPYKCSRRNEPLIAHVVISRARGGGASASRVALSHLTHSLNQLRHAHTSQTMFSSRPASPDWRGCSLPPQV